MAVTIKKPMEGEGISIVVDPGRYNLISRTFDSGRGSRVRLSPEEISRIDVVYGPFSALYPGNSSGGVLAITTRMPEGREIHFKGLGAAQTYSLYGYNDAPFDTN